MNTEVIISDEDRKYLSDCIMDLKESRSNATVLTDKLKAISRIIKRCYGINTELTILDTEMDQDFFGFNIYPDEETLGKLVILTVPNPKVAIAVSNPDAPLCDNAMEIWKECERWHIDIDAKVLYSLSFRFTPDEIMAILISSLEKTIFCPKRLCIAVNAVTQLQATCDPQVKSLMRSKYLKNFLVIPYLQACSFTTFDSNVHEESIFANDPKLFEIYDSFLHKLVTYYGNGLVDRKWDDLVKELQYTTFWIFESLNDCKYNLTKIRKGIKDQILATKSLYVKDILKSLAKNLLADEDMFASDGLPYIMEEKFIPANPKLNVLKEKMREDIIIKKIEAIKEEYNSDMFDRNGYCKRVTDEEIDILRLEIQKIETVDDKIYYMEKCYDKLSIVNYALSLLDSDEKSLNSKVKDSRSKLEKQQESLMRIRDMIVATNIAPKRYGLFIKYPKGYEG